MRSLPQIRNCRCKIFARLPFFFSFFKPIFIVAEIHLYLAQMECSFATTMILISLLQLQKHDAHFPKPKPTVTSTASRFCSCKRQFFCCIPQLLRMQRRTLQPQMFTGETLDLPTPHRLLLRSVQLPSFSSTQFVQPEQFPSGVR